jgi:hypothetical protein
MIEYRAYIKDKKYFEMKSRNKEKVKKEKKKGLQLVHACKAAKE